jgi:hypothetical protein
MISKPLAVRKTQMPTICDFRIHWHPMKYFFIIHWHKSETIGIYPQVENVGDPKKTSQNPLAYLFKFHWQHKWETIGSDPQSEIIGNSPIQFRILWHTQCETVGLVLNTQHNQTQHDALCCMYSWHATTETPGHSTM